MRSGKHTLKHDPKMGLNGQVRVIESSSCAECFGFVMGYTRDEATLANWVYYSVTTTTTTTSDTLYQTSDLIAKQRNTFGSYLVINRNKY